MVKRIFILLVIVALLYSAYRFWWAPHEQTLRADSGDFTCQGCDSPEEHARFLKENSGETADGNSEHKLASARVAAEQAYNGDTASSAPSTTTPAPGSPTVAPAPGTSTMVAPADQSAQTTVYPPAPSSSSSSPVVIPTTGQPGALPAGLPTRDTESPNAPNGMRFAGSGSYQWYRQGNITWRVDTTTGRSCIIYATMEEWRKQIVMSHGCGRDA